MQLKKYLEEQGISQKLFAEKLGIHVMTMFKITNRIRLPSLDIAMKIENITFGKVTCEDFLREESKEKGKKKQGRKTKNGDDKLKLRVSAKPSNDLAKDISHVQPLSNKKKALI